VIVGGKSPAGGGHWIHVEFALVLRELWRRKPALVAGALVASVCAVLSVYRVAGLGLTSRPITYSGASTQALIDTPRSALADITQNIEPLQVRAVVLANFMASPSFLSQVGARVGLTGGQIYAQGPLDPQLPRTEQEPTALKRNVELTGETAPYRLTFNSDPNLPQIGVYSQAPTTKMAVALANASVKALRSYVSRAESQTKVPAGSRAEIRQLGRASGAQVNGGISKSIFGLVFTAVMLVWCVGILAVTRLRENWRLSAEFEQRSAAPVPARPATAADEAPSPLAQRREGDADTGDANGSSHGSRTAGGVGSR
jgi:hypothetical protein